MMNPFPALILSPSEGCGKSPPRELVGAVWDARSEAWYGDGDPNVDFPAAPVWAFRQSRATRQPWAPPTCPTLRLLDVYPVRLLAAVYPECRRVTSSRPGFCSACMTFTAEALGERQSPLPATARTRSGARRSAPREAAPHPGPDMMEDTDAFTRFFGS